MQDMKFKVQNREQSDALQKVLVSQGYKQDDNVTIDTTELTYLFAYSDGEITSVGTKNNTYFDVHENEEMNTSQYINNHFAAEPEKPPARNKYSREISPGIWVDVYDVLNAWTVTDPCLQHLIKKALAVGQRGHKDAETDYKDILASSKRALEIFNVWKENSEN